MPTPKIAHIGPKIRAKNVSIHKVCLLGPKATKENIPKKAPNPPPLMSVVCCRIDLDFKTSRNTQITQIELLMMLHVPAEVYQFLPMPGVLHQPQDLPH